MPSIPHVVHVMHSQIGHLFSPTTPNKQTKQTPKPKKAVKPQPNSPPQLQTSIQVDKIFRFRSSAAGTIALEPNDLLFLLSCSISATQSASLATSVKLKEISMWGPMAADLVPVQVSIDWNTNNSGLFGGRSNEIVDLSMTASHPAKLRSKPPKDSVCRQWLNASNSLSMCTFSFPVNCIIDIRVSFMLRDESTTAPLLSTSTIATVGLFGVIPIGVLQPIGLVALA